MNDTNSGFWDENEYASKQAPPTQYNLNQQASEPQHANNQQGMPIQIPPSQSNYYQQGIPNQIHGQPSTIPLNQGISASFYPETSAMTAIILAALSFAMCGLFTAIPAVIMARKALDITDNVPNHPDAGTAKAAFILGWVNIGLFILGILFWLAFFALGLSFGWY